MAIPGLLALAVVAWMPVASSRPAQAATTALETCRKNGFKVTVTVLEPVKLSVDPALTGKHRRMAAGAALYEAEGGGGEGTAEEIKRSMVPYVHQFVWGEADGPVPFHYPGLSYQAALGMA